MNILPQAKKNTKTLMLCFIISYHSFGQSDVLQDMNVRKWQLDLDYVVNITTSEFALFTNESKQLFIEKAAELRMRFSQLNRNQSIVEISKLLAVLNEGHTELKLFGADLGFQRLPVLLYYFDKELRVFATNEKYKNLLGSKVNRIGNSTIKEVHKKLSLLISGDNEIENYYQVPRHIIIPELLVVLGIIDNPTSAEFTLELMNGKEQKTNIGAISMEDYLNTNFIRITNDSPTPLYKQNSKDINIRHWFKYLNEKEVMYYRIRGFGDRKGYLSLKKKTKQVFKEMEKENAKKLVIDLRSNGGGNYGLGLSIVKNILKRPEIMKRGNLYVITDRVTFSAAGYIAALLKRDCNALIIGEKSRDNPNGGDNYERHTMPNSNLVFGVADRIKTDFPEIINPHLPLDIEIKFKFNDYAKGYDPVIEYILKN